MLGILKKVPIPLSLLAEIASGPITAAMALEARATMPLPLGSIVAALWRLGVQSDTERRLEWGRRAPFTAAMNSAVYRAHTPSKNKGCLK